MGYSKHIYEKAESIMSLRRQNAVQQANNKREDKTTKLPRVREEEREGRHERDTARERRSSRERT